MTVNMLKQLMSRTLTPYRYPSRFPSCSCSLIHQDLDLHKTPKTTPLGSVTVTIKGCWRASCYITQCILMISWQFFTFRTFFHEIRCTISIELVIPISGFNVCNQVYILAFINFLTEF